MINAYAGLPRSGKSYSVVKNIILKSLGKRPVYTNIPMVDDELKKAGLPLPTYFTNEEILQNEDYFKTVEAGACVIFDECWHIWPSGLKANNMRAGDKEFLTMHGHMSANGYSTEIVLIVQDLSMICSFVRQLVNYTYRTTKLDAIGASNRFKVQIYQGAVTGQSPPQTRLLKTETNQTYDKDVYKFYKSQTMNEDGVHGDESSTDGRTNLLKSFGLKFGIIFIVLFASMYFVSTLFSGSSDESFAPDYQPSDLPKSNVKPSSPKPKRQRPARDYLQDHQVYIVYNNRVGIHYHYDFLVQNKTSNAYLSADDMRLLGYKVNQVSSCVALISINGHSRPVFCVRDIQKKEDNNPDVKLVSAD